MRKILVGLMLMICAAGWFVTRCAAHSEHNAEAAATPLQTRSSPGANPWNRGRQPADWRAEIERYHGHVGPWNVLGWRIGQAAMRELGVEWGDHSLEIICHIPMSTPYSCLIEGLMVGTGNSQGRLDLRVSEELTSATIHVSVRKIGTPRTLEFWPHAVYLNKIESRPVSELAKLVDECAKMPDADLFTIRP